MHPHREHAKSGDWSAAAIAGLIGAAAVIILLKVVTGLGLMPLAIVAILAFVVVSAFRLRMIRTG